MPSKTPSDEQEHAQISDERTHSFIKSQESFAKMRAKGLYALVDGVHELELKRDHPLAQRKDLSWWRLHGIPFLASIPERVISGIISGKLAYDWVNGDPDLAKLYGKPSNARLNAVDEPEISNWHQNASTETPGHYVCYLVDPSGLPPTIRELCTILDSLRDYIQPLFDPEIGQAIDNAKDSGCCTTEEQAQAGYFYFLCQEEDDRVRSAERITIISKFIIELERRIQTIPEQGRDQRDERALAYVGYALKLMERIKEHEEGTTSFLKNLIEHIVQYHKMDYRWKSFITSYSVSYEDSCLGEILINGLSQAYHDTGYGVVVHPAGENCESSKLSSRFAEEADELWNLCKRFRINATPYKKYMELEMERVDKIRDQAENEEGQYEADLKEYIKDLDEAREEVVELRKIRADLPRDMPRDPTDDELDKIIAEAEQCVSNLARAIGKFKGNMEKLRKL